MMIYYLCYIIWTYKKAPGAKTYISTRWSDITKMIEGDLRNPKMHTFIFTIIFTFHVFHDFESIPQDLRVPLRHLIVCILNLMNSQNKYIKEPSQINSN